MPKRKFTIIDDNGEEQGFVVVDVAPTFQHTEPGPILPYSETLNDALLFVTVLGGFTAVAWLIPGPRWFAPAVGIVLTALLAGLRAWRGYIVTPAADTDSDIMIRGEFTSDTGTIHIDEFTDKSIRFPQLQRLCAAMVKHVDPLTNEMPWLGRGRAKLLARVTREQHDRIRAEFTRLNYFREGDKGQMIIAGRGRLFVRRIASLKK